MSKIDYTIGDDIVAIKDHSKGLYKKGQIFVCKAMQIEPCKCKELTIDIGMVDERLMKESPNSCILHCYICGEVTPYTHIIWLAATSFKKLDFDISELTNILEKEKVAK